MFLKGIRGKGHTESINHKVLAIGLGTFFIICQAILSISPTAHAAQENDPVAEILMPYNNVIAVLFADLDMDGAQEVIYGIIGTGDQLADGTFEPYSVIEARGADGHIIWSVRIEDSWLSNQSIAIGDVDGDSYPEIIVGSEYGIGTKGGILVLEHDGRIKWSVSEDRERYGVPMLNDLDGDGVLDIVICNWHTELMSYRGDGTLLWNRYLPHNEMSYSSGDLDGDGDIEIVVANRVSTSSTSWDSEILILDSDGSDQNMVINITDEKICAPPVLGDLDGDGDLEIVVVVSARVPDSGKIYVYHHDGTLLDGWPKITDTGVGSRPYRSGASLADIDKDGDLEIFVNGKTGKVYGWHHTGESITGWPAIDENPAQSNARSPVIGDIDGDGEAEIVINSDDCTLTAFNADGTLVLGYPKKLIEDPLVPHYLEAISLGRIDNNTYIAVGTGSDNTGHTNYDMLFLLDTNTPYDQAAMEWPTQNHDPQRTGCYKDYEKISIELSAGSWDLYGVRAGEMRDNLNYDGVPIHNIKNIGKTRAMLDIKYMGIAQDSSGKIKPGLEQGLDTFITLVGEKILPLEEGLPLGAIGPEEDMPLYLVHGAPTEVSEPHAILNIYYAIRAYKATME